MADDVPVVTAEFPKPAEQVQAPVEPPDPKKDRVYCILGGAMFLVPEAHVNIADSAPVWAELVPVEPTEAEKQGVRAYPKERYIRVLHELCVGTIEEIAADVKEGLLRSFNALSCINEDGSAKVIPTIGEASLRKQTAVIVRNGIDSFTKSLTASASIIDAREELRNKMDGFKPRQDGYTRAFLARLVGTYFSRRFLPGSSGYPCNQPTDDPAAVQELIDALKVFKEDTESKKAARAERVPPAAPPVQE